MDWPAFLGQLVPAHYDEPVAHGSLEALLCDLFGVWAESSGEERIEIALRQLDTQRIQKCLQDQQLQFLRKGRHAFATRFGVLLQCAAPTGKTRRESAPTGP